MERNAVIGRVFREDGRKIAYALYKAGCPQQDVEDIVHQTMVLALENFDSLEDKTKATAWCIRIAVNYFYRKGQRDNRMVIADFSEEEHLVSVCDEKDLLYDDDSFENALNKMEIKRLISKLTPENAVPLMMQVEYGSTYEEIAEATGVKVGTVRSRLSRAKKILGEIIKKERANETEELFEKRCL